jgi:hypothetical protein
MTSHGRRITCAAVLLAATVAGAAHASVQIFFNKNSWVDAVGGQDAFTTIGFNTGTPMWLPTDYYAAQGVLFPEGDEGTGIYPGNPSGDGWILNTVNNTITMDLTTPRTHLAIETTATLYQLRLFRQGVLQSQVWVSGPFTGVLSAQPFDRAILINTGANGVIIDDLHFGGIPSPGGLAVLVATTLLGGRGRRRR